MNKKREIQNILVTGNMGYIGSVLTPMLISKGYNIWGFDTGFYDHDCLLYSNNNSNIKQIKKDIRDITKEDLNNIDAVIHLASLSNDPLGELNPDITEEINYKATIQLADCAKSTNVKRFIYASSQSMYGISKDDVELDEDKSMKNPITSYAKTKWQAECELKNMNCDDFIVTCFRPSTVFGESSKLRCDIVYNNLVACAYTTNRIEIKSDGYPWRPVIHINDVSNAFISGIIAPKELVANQSFNVGFINGNFTIRQIAEAAQSVVKGTNLIFTGEHGSDARTYRVSFKKIYSKLGDFFKPQWDLYKGGNQLVQMFDKIKFAEKDFRGDKTNRLLHLKKLIESKQINDNLRWLN